jgi:hypothetical protein
LETIEKFADREEVLEICFWYKGEGFGDEFTPMAISQFVELGKDKISTVLEKLCLNGSMENVKNDCYRFTKNGLKQAGKLFVESFQEMQQPGHYECVDGCCDGDDHSNCKHN